MCQATLSISGSVNTCITVSLTDTISSVLEHINIQNVLNSKNDFTISNSNVLFNNTLLSPAFSLMFYGVHDGCHLIVLRKDQNPLSQLHLDDRMNYSTDDIHSCYANDRRKLYSRNNRSLTRNRSQQLFHNQEISHSSDYYPHGISSSQSSVDLTLGEINNDNLNNQNAINIGAPSYRSISNSDTSFNLITNHEHSNSILNPNISLNRNDQKNRSSNDLVNKKVQKFFMEKCSGNMRDPEFVFQRFKDSINPKTAFEAARITDIYRSRIESNSSSFRKLCKKYNNLSSNDRIRKNTSMPTILPAKAGEPSTDLLPELCTSEGRPIHTGQ
ncbi:hypothetical protein M9Y10_045935 [Tritrichomonas musculus]|uniref:Ubiquitin-like domain-containing protein n=1 Tax=Tritrichomonas musculus TaxID=1915356 RepID=A0ABR2JWY0_9EUKA